MTKKEPAMIPPNVPCSLQPMYVATCWASGPGRSMQKLSVRRYCCSETQRLFSTSSRCMIAICPAGPPKLMNPSFTQNQNASQNPTGLVSTSTPTLSSVIFTFFMCYGNKTCTSVTTVTPGVKWDLGAYLARRDRKWSWDGLDLRDPLKMATAGGAPRGRGGRGG